MLTVIRPHRATPSSQLRVTYVKPKNNQAKEVPENWLLELSKEWASTASRGKRETQTDYSVKIGQCLNTALQVTGSPFWFWLQCHKKVAAQS